MRLVCIHGFDPRGPKVGGIETHVRQVLRHHPADMRALIVGIDDSGTLALGQLHRIILAGRELDFFPVLHVASEAQVVAAASVGQSVTLRFAAAVLRHLPALRRLLHGKAAVAEIERVEFAPLVRLLGLPFVLVSHLEADPRVDRMESMLSKHWYVNHAGEWLAVRLAGRIFGVTARIRDRIAGAGPAIAAKTDVLTVSVDTALFRSAPFDLGDGKLRLVYAGRLDAVKDPPLLFRTAAQVHALLGGAFEFHYCGSADPHRFAEFAAIAPFTVLHGALVPEQVAAVMRHAHVGTLVSHWEGMPCFLLELLASGRPFCGLRLPQFGQVVEEGVSGRTVARADTVEATASAVAQAMVRQWDDIRAGRVDPAALHARVLPWSVDSQLGRLFAAMRMIARPGTAPGPAR